MLVLKRLLRKTYLYDQNKSTVRSRPLKMTAKITQMVTLLPSLS